MVLALWVIAACQIIRLLQNAWQLKMLRHDSTGRDNAYSEFVKSLKQDDAGFVRRMLEEFEKQDENKSFRDVMMEYEAEHPLMPYNGKGDRDETDV